MDKPHVPIERDIAEFVIRYRDGGNDPGYLLSAIGRAFPGCSYGVAGRAITIAEQRRPARGGR